MVFMSEEEGMFNGQSCIESVSIGFEGLYHLSKYLENVQRVYT